MAIEGAVFIRYTNIVELAVASIAVLALKKAAGFSWRNIAIWLGSAVVFGIGVLGFNEWAYGKATSTGYSAGEISFSLSSLWPNLKGMPKQLTSAMPLWILAAAAVCWIVIRLARLGREQNRDVIQERGRDAIVAVVLGIDWLGLWALYLTYTWTAGQLSGTSLGLGSITVHVIRFYLPALDCITLLATWTLSRLKLWLSWQVIAVLAVAGVLSFNSMASTGAVGGVGGPGGAGPGGGATQILPPAAGGGPGPGPG